MAPHGFEPIHGLGFKNKIMYSKTIKDTTQGVEMQIINPMFTKCCDYGLHKIGKLQRPP